MPTLPQFQSDDKDFQLMQNAWSSFINPIINRAQNQSNIIKNVSLLSASNPNVVNHLLGKTLSGWKVVRQRASAIVWDTQDTCQTPALTLNLRTSADVVVDLECF